ncbi:MULTISPECIES: HemK2/MTQ2 family protein methyltransferase [Haloferax]|uniref:Methyltransferase n=2 Tax=Haloferax TaxID=2251 RepID=A0A6G1Z2G1_9EURY|nr:MULTISPECIES: HemK2/MTQ2 family protein methyltransferase [Haloferax]KAB1188086.1 methyltransferase [Haloferax sp. CBA1149]MRW80759.1 methyltransferase [Haloferax marinisediminis]
MTDLAERRGMNTSVYQPAEDSGLLAQAVIGRVSGRVLEVGTGSGWVAEQLVRKTDAEVVASDLNPHACEQAAERSAALREEGERGFHVVRGNLVSPFRDDSFDAVAFNPPYLPEDLEAARDDWMEVALTGGKDGREIINPFLDTVGRVLKPGGEVYLLVSSLTGYDEVLARAEENGFGHEVVVQESYPYETLTVLALK